MENTEQARDLILEKKMEDYSSYLRDFKAEGELIVTITLNEYRSLVESKASSQTYVSDNYNLKKQVAELQSEVSEKDQRISALDQYIAALDKRITTLDKHITTLTGRLKAARRLIKAFKAMGETEK